MTRMVLGEGVLAVVDCSEAEIGRLALGRGVPVAAGCLEADLRCITALE